jgi:rhodanese-related sulfurtransferase
MDRLFEFAGHHPLLVSAAALAAVLVIAYEARLHMLGAVAVSPQELIRLMNQGALVLDLRSADQYAAGHINGARPMTSDQISNAGDALKRHKQKPVVVYCEGAGHASAAVRQLASQGFTKVFSLRGGLSAWRAENLPVAKA